MSHAGGPPSQHPRPFHFPHPKLVSPPLQYGTVRIFLLRDADHCSAWLAVQHVWPWLYDNAEDRKLFTALQSQLKFIKEYAKDGYVALHHLEAELVAGCLH